jgi:hypothetical protein
VKRWMVCLLLLAGLVVGGRAQNATQAPNPPGATVTFDCYWEPATPQRYVIVVSDSGNARYVSQGPQQSPDANGVPDEDYQLEFASSPGVRTKIFQLAEQTGYFNGDFDFRKHAIANTGNKTLTYRDATRQFTTVYNWSENPAIDQLTRIFHGISATIEHGRKLKFLRRFDKLGLEAELKGMERQVENHELAELQIIATVLENIANDTSVLNIARQRARRLLEQSKGEGWETKPGSKSN